MRLRLLAALALLIGSVIIAYVLHKLKPVKVEKIKKPAIPSFDGVPARTNGVVFVTNALSGSAREAVHQLHRVGYHVLLGVRNKVEKQTFTYDNHKGLELMEFDFTQPNTLVETIYRLRHIKRDLYRPLSAIVINVADILLYSRSGIKNDDSSDILGKSVLNVEEMDRLYRMIVKNPVRLIQSMIELGRLQYEDQRNQLPLHQPLICEDTNQNCTNFNTGGLRILLLTVNYTQEIQNNRCDLRCELQETMLNIFHTLLLDEKLLNISVSIIPTISKEQLNTLPTIDTTGIAKTLNKFQQQILRDSIPWSVDSQGNDNNNMYGGSSYDAGHTLADSMESLSVEAKSIIHALSASKPFEHYYYDEITQYHQYLQYAKLNNITTDEVSVARGKSSKRRKNRQSRRTQDVKHNQEL